MPLIIDTYEVPAIDLAISIYKKSNIVPFPVESPLNGSLIDNNTLYYIHKETQYNLRAIKYYFNEIVEVDQFVIQINKQRKTLKHYRVLFGYPLRIEEIKDKEKQTVVDKSDFLPHLKAQEDELVIFPEEEEE